MKKTGDEPNICIKHSLPKANKHGECMVSYVLVSQHQRHQNLFEHLQSEILGNWVWITDKEQLCYQNLANINPRYIFIPHWSFKVPEKIYQSFECIMFHMTDLPFGRGGSPLQNLIVRGFKETKLTAFRCSDKLDSGPVYGKLILSLSGNAQEIFTRADKLATKLIVDIIQNDIQPASQQGEVVEFKRRMPEQSDISGLATLEEIYDYIRMLDSEGYPAAFLDFGAFRMEFHQANKEEHKVTAQVVIKEKIRV